MNLANDGAKYGVDQYRFAHNYDLKSKSFDIKSDNSKYSITFKGNEKLTFISPSGEETVGYECLKIEDDTYFIDFGTNVAVLELSKGLATLLLDSETIFGVIEMPNKSSAVEPHAFTDEMTGTAVCWMMGCNKYVNHIYYAGDKCRAAWSPDGESFAVCSSKYIKIKDGIYLVKVEGTIPSGAAAPSGESSFIALQDYDHMMFVGCIKSKNSSIIVSGYGEFPEFDKALYS